jgi:hypothetical protein
VFLFDQVTDDLVVEILYMFPFNALPLILLLLRLECQFYEQLLKFFIAEVYAELLKTEKNMWVMSQNCYHICRRERKMSDMSFI